MDWFVVTSALSLAAMYGLLGIGISLTWSSIGMLNLAHGFTFAAAGYGAWWALEEPRQGADVGHRRADRRRRRHRDRRRRRARASG